MTSDELECYGYPFGKLSFVAQGIPRERKFEAEWDGLVLKSFTLKEFEHGFGDPVK